MKIALAADHAGYRMKDHLRGYLQDAGHVVIDLGVHTDETRSDYPDAAEAVGVTVQSMKAERGIIVCGSGVGVCIAANKLSGIYACLCHDTYSAAQGVQHDNMNVLSLGAMIIDYTSAEKLVDAFLGAQFEASTERYVRRFQKVQSMEK
jgi:ribose 5-phosphate isomerase B